ncbi:MAG: cytidylate kinase-like family protein [Paludibacteraceae bacterium]|nr:cytidylate kinase-like family protein [Paludibacteraceae bacterium]MBR5972660.1 cytidylate kinase-like family protein [Paludibacteraceae bacterium]
MENKNNLIISIGRQFGAGGRAVGKKLAERLGIDYYDKELIFEAAKDYGFAPEFFENVDEKSASFSGNVLQWVESLITGGFQSKNFLSQDALFEMQSNAIRRLTEEKSCIIVGRCSDYVLRDNPNCVSVFLHSTDDDRANRISQRNGITKEEALAKMEVEDKRRAAYYNFYSSKTWGMASTYTLSINVSTLGVDGTVEFIVSYLKQVGLIG